MDAAPAAAPHIRSGMHAVIITRPSPTPYSSPLATAIIAAKQLKLIHFFGGGKSAACNDTNCPDLNAVIGPLGALERKWLQLRLFHFLATQARAYNLKGETLCITCAPQLEMQPNECKIVGIKETSGEDEEEEEEEEQEGNKQKSGSMCVK